MYKIATYIRSGSVNPNALSITKTGRINLNKHYVKRYGLSKNMGAMLYWDEGESKIALTFTEKNRTGAFPLGFVPNGQAAYVIAIQFFRSHKLDPEKYAAAYGFEVTTPSRLSISEENDEVFVIDLKVPMN